VEVRGETKVCEETLWVTECWRGRNSEGRKARSFKYDADQHRVISLMNPTSACSIRDSLECTPTWTVVTGVRVYTHRCNVSQEGVGAES